MENSSASPVRENIPRSKLIQKVADKECVENCNSKWLQFTEEVLANNMVHPIVFAAAVREL